MADARWQNSSSSSIAVQQEGIDLADLAEFEYNDAEVLVLSIVYYVMSAVGVSTNLILVSRIVREPAFHTVGYLLMAHLAGAEVLMTACQVWVGHSTSLYHYIHGHAGGILRWHMDLLGMFLVFGYLLSFYLMVVLSFNRLCSVVYYASYKSIFTTRRYRLIMAGVYTFALCVVLPQLLVVGISSYAYYPKLWGYALDNKNPARYPLSPYLFSFGQTMAVVGVLAMIVIYIMIFVKLRALEKARSHRSKVTSAGSNPATLGNPHKAKREDILLTVQFFVVTIIFIILWIFLALYTYGIDAVQSEEGKKWITTGRNLVLTLDSNVNPLVYMIINKRVQGAIMHTATCGRWRREDGHSTAAQAAPAPATGPRADVPKTGACTATTSAVSRTRVVRLRV